MKTFASMFTGFGGADLGAIQAGLKPIWGVEIDPQIKAIQNNAFYQISHDYFLRTDAEDVKSIDWTKKRRFGQEWKHFQRPDWLHASPPCVNASRANNGKEAQEDLDLADAICRAITVLKPSYFSLENVSGYIHFQAFDKIADHLAKTGYSYTCQVFEMANYGVPQSRRRLFLVASKDCPSYPNINIPIQQPVSWYEAIEDLIPTLKETNLNGWQKTTLENNDYPIEFGLFKSFPILAIQRSGARQKNRIPNNTIRLANEPMFTIKSMAGNIRPNPRQVTLIVEGKILEPDERCLARWQGFPDSYQFSGNFKLDTKGIGNAVPPSFFSQLIKEVLNANP